MTSHQLTIGYTLADNPQAESERPTFTAEPAGSSEVRFSATNLRSVDRLDVCWSNAWRMKNDGKNPAAVALGKLGRAANTKAQKEAARRNGAKGGRPAGSKDSKPRTRGKS